MQTPTRLPLQRDQSTTRHDGEFAYNLFMFVSFCPSLACGCLSTGNITTGTKLEFRSVNQPQCLFFAEITIKVDELYSRSQNEPAFGSWLMTIFLHCCYFVSVWAHLCSLQQWTVFLTYCAGALFSLASEWKVILRTWCRCLIAVD